MRLKIQITGGFLGDARKNWPSNLPAVIQFRFARMRIVKHNKSDKLRMIRWQIAEKRNDVLAVVVSAVRIDFFRGSGFPGNRKSWHGSGGSCSLIAHHAAQRITNLFGS